MIQSGRTNDIVPFCFHNVYGEIVGIEYKNEFCSEGLINSKDF